MKQNLIISLPQRSEAPLDAKRVLMRKSPPHRGLFIILTGLMVTLILLACTPTVTNTPGPNTAPIVVDPLAVVEPGFNILVVAQGEIQLKRVAWSAYHPITFGTALERGDLIQLSSGAKASVLCDGLTVWHVPSGAPSGLTNGCPQPSEVILIRGGAGIASPTRGGGDKDIPYLISPRSTDLLSNTPTLRWNDSGASIYTVQIRGGDLNWLPTEIISSPELSYPGEPALEPGVSYLLVVEDDNGKSSQDEDQVGLGFKLLTDDKAEPIREHTERILGLTLPDEAKLFAQAQLYAGQNLTAEAIEILEGVLAEGNQQVLVQQTLADLYTDIGLTLLAEPRYLAAIQLAATQNNVESAAAIQASLGQIYIDLGNESEAIAWLEKAQSGYELLGDTEQAAVITGLLAELNP